MLSATHLLMSKVVAAIAAATAVFGTTGTLCQIGLFLNEITPTPDLTFEDLEMLTTGGSSAMLVEGVAAPQAGGQDAASDQWEVRVKPPVGGWVFPVGEATTLPATIRGYAVMDSEGAVLFTKTFDEPIVVNYSHETLDLGKVAIQFPVGNFQ